MQPDGTDAPYPADAPAAAGTVLNIRTLSVGFGPAKVLDGIDLPVGAGELVCDVGESGSGKSVTALAAMGLLPGHAHVAADGIDLDGRAILPLSEREPGRLRGKEMALIFQEPMTSLNPVMTIGAQIMEPLRQHHRITAAEARRQTMAMLERVQIPAARERFGMYPHQLSGGLRQRVMIAMTLVCRPRLLIADEPTTALDVTIQSQILRLIDELRTEMGTSVLFITHDLAVVSEIADRIAVIYAGRIAEEGTRDQIFDDPTHPYTLALFAALPRPSHKGKALASIGGQVPAPDAMPDGCRFTPHCPFAVAKCHSDSPPLDVADGHRDALWRATLEAHVG